MTSVQVIAMKKRLMSAMKMCAMADGAARECIRQCPIEIEELRIHSDAYKAISSMFIGTMTTQLIRLEAELMDVRKLEAELAGAEGKR